MPDKENICYPEFISGFASDEIYNLFNALSVEIWD